MEGSKRSGPIRISVRSRIGVCAFGSPRPCAATPTIGIGSGGLKTSFTGVN